MVFQDNRTTITGQQEITTTGHLNNSTTGELDNKTTVKWNKWTMGLPDKRQWDNWTIGQWANAKTGQQDNAIVLDNGTTGQQDKHIKQKILKKLWS